MSIVKEIRTGVHDDLLEDILSAVIQRRKVMGHIQFGAMKPGDRVQFVNNVKPTYLAGLQATVVGKKVTKLIVRLDQPVGRFRGELKVPPQIVEKVG